MPLTKVVTLLDRVASTLQDTTNVRWPKAELLVYLNDAQRQIVLHRPDANPVNTTFSCVASSKQSLPPAALRLLSIKRNVDGRSITQMSQDVLDIQLPNWHQQAATANGVEHYIYDPLDPKTFYLYPVPVAAHPIEVVYSTAPTEIVVANFATDVQTITLDDIYVNVIMD